MAINRVDIISLKPCVLTIVEDDYTEELAIAHIGRFLHHLLWLFSAKNHSDPRNQGIQKEVMANGTNALLLSLKLVFTIEQDIIEGSMQFRIKIDMKNLYLRQKLK
ncbi:hypothetical protein AMTR_s00089p00124310 [Amborella trichopoda]|uniref:Uncharacterized protein n=1 Tax=Amborella trichopoda TaxID=13333 RepID=W1P1T6_AMBTC|nr:hypothetical protein AMTR_s00089p00124310 [Amborella trichopoda]